MASGASTSDLELDTALLRCVYHLYHAVAYAFGEGAGSAALVDG